MGVMDYLYIKRTCPRCNKVFYPGDCDIVSAKDKKNPKVLREAPKGGIKQHLERITPPPISGDLVLELGHRRCMHCGYLLPTNIEKVNNINIAIVGDTFSGKSHYIAALIHQIQEGQIQQADKFARFDCMTQDIEQDYTVNVFNLLFKDKRSPGGTQMATEINREPLIYELIITPSPDHPARRVNLILYDPSGEDLAIKERMVQFSRYVLNANAIIFLADPVSMPQIYSRLPAFLQNQHATGRTASSVLNSIIRLIEDYRGVSAGAQFASTPIAITVAKSDLLKNLTTLQYPFYFSEQPPYEGAIDLEDLDRVDKEVKDLLQKYGERTLLSATSNFSQVHFFAVSATGYAPDKNDEYPNVEPCRCLDPILWILYKLDILHNIKNRR